MNSRFTIDPGALRDLAAYEVVAEQKSFTRAARSLGLTTSALSQTIRRLEAGLKITLLNRTTRSVSVTAAGEKLLLKLKPALAGIADAVGELRALEGQLSGTLRINSSRVARYVLAPFLAEFQRAHPDVDVEVVADDALTDIISQRFDAGVRLGESLERDMVALPLNAKLEVWFVASPQYLRVRGEPEHPRDLLQHNCIVLTGPTHGQPIAWRFTRGRKSLEVVPRGSLRVTDAELALEAARLGAGITMTFDAMAGEDVERGKLQRVLEPWTPTFGGFSLYYPSRTRSTPQLQAFIEVVKARRRGQRDEPHSPTHSARRGLTPRAPARR